MDQGRERRFAASASGGHGPRAGGGAAPSAREWSPQERELQLTLTGVLEGRCDVLMRAAPPETRQTDAPMIMQCLGRLDDSVIRQPPIAAQRALAVARNPMSSAAQLVAIFEQDPALTEALLEMANSSYYHRGNQPCVAIPEAIQRVGVSGIESIVTKSMVEGLLCRPGSAYMTLLSQVWGHMMRTAPIARALAPAFQAEPETAFTLGLLHDVGKLMLFDYLSQLRTQHRREIKLPERFLLDMLGRLHEPLGGIAALRWNLGASVARSIAWHHRQPPPESPDLLTELLCVSEYVDHAIAHKIPVDLWQIARDHELTADPRKVRERLENIEGVTVNAAPEHRGTRAA